MTEPYACDPNGPPEYIDRDDFTGCVNVTDDDLTPEQHNEADRLLAEYDPDEWGMATYDWAETDDA